ncbi:MAG: DUF4147 domain-containing protein [Planctomycetaceae bacterium]|jgi:glycerate-2-kinase|nr:DUF4147 domain-containing protein [Planctomycetaceae bacterium]
MNPLREDMLAIWQAGVDGVNVRRLIAERVFTENSNENEQIWIDEVAYPLKSIRKISVIGAGKAAAGMSAAIEQSLSQQVDTGLLSGFINIPQDCEIPLRVIRQQIARPAGVNEPTDEGVFSTRQMLQFVEKTNRELTSQNIPLSEHLVICLISGGGSALMPLPADGVTLEQKLAVTRFLSAAGATINEMNIVRKQMSDVKGGKLRRWCGGATLVTLILSDVLGDPLDIIASGPTVENLTTAADAIYVLEKYGFLQSETAAEISENVMKFLQTQVAVQQNQFHKTPQIWEQPLQILARNIVIGNNATAVDAAGIEAEKRGYSYTMICATSSEGNAEPLGELFAERALRMCGENSVDRISNCLISGGEPTVSLVSLSQRGLGGRNQQLVLAMICKLLSNSGWLERFRENPAAACPFAFLSGGTDGEDGPTDAAGAFFDSEILRNIVQSDISPADFISRNDAYHFFERFNALLKTGATGTNVCDVRVLVKGKNVPC